MKKTNDDILQPLLAELAKKEGSEVIAIFVGYVTEDGQGHGITAVHPDVDYEPDPGTEKLSVEVAFLTSIRDAVENLLAQKAAN